MNPILPVAEPLALKKLTGMQRAAVLMLALGKEHGEPLWNEFSEDEIKDLSAAMAQLGSVPAKSVEHLFVQFASDVANMTSCHGSFESTRSEEHTSELQSLMSKPYAGFCLKKQKNK